MQCFQCGKALSYDEIGLTRKLVRRDATECLCLTCLSRNFGVSVSRLQEKIEEYRAAGCSPRPESLKKTTIRFLEHTCPRLSALGLTCSHMYTCPRPAVFLSFNRKSGCPAEILLFGLVLRRPLPASGATACPAP